MTITTNPEYYRPFDNNDFFYDRCFLCGKDLNKENTSAEHVFPKWLQHKFNLWYDSLVLINGSQISYRLLTIPCCRTCNNGPLSKMEEHFKFLMENNFQNLNAVDEKVIFQWTAKLLYGSIYKNLSLDLDRKNPQLGKIVNPKFVEGYSTLHLFLQSIRISTLFSDPFPWSIFVFQYEDDDFDYTNDYINLSLSIKLGKIGIVITFEDNKAVENDLSLMKGLYSFPLNNIQFLEVTSRIFYKKSLALNVSKYLTNYHIITENIQVNCLNTIQFRDWKNEEYSSVFETFLERDKINVEFPIYNNGILSTFLVDKDKELYVDKIKKIQELDQLPLKN